MLPLDSSNYKKFYKRFNFESDMTEEPSFGLPRQRNPLDRFIGKYVIIYTHRDDQYLGQAQMIDGEYLVINPFQGKEIGEDEKFFYRIIEEDAMVKISDIGGVEPTTRVNLERNCLRLNKKIVLKNQVT
jgi:hypothetical protein